MKIIKQTVLSLVIGAIVLIAVGCKNTAEGVGEDVEKAGEKIQKKVD
jgi:predicted small secreted protein